MFDTRDHRALACAEGGSDSESEAARERAALLDDPDVQDERILALVPWADTLNHTSAASERSILQYDATNDAAVLFAHRDYAEGDEVFDSYGRNLTPSELLLDYGFVDMRNRISAVTVRLDHSFAHTCATLTLTDLSVCPCAAI